jgi:hypothetical protein
MNALRCGFLSAVLLALLAGCGKEMPTPADASPVAAAPAGDRRPYLANSGLPPAFEVEFKNYLVSKERAEPGVPGRFWYSYPAQKSGAPSPGMRTWFALCPSLPCVEQSWIDAGASCTFYLVRDPNQGGKFASYVFTKGLVAKGQPQEQYALVGINIGPLLPDSVKRYNDLFPRAPLWEPNPTSPTPLLSPANVPVQWYLTSGHAGFIAATQPGGPPVQTDPVNTPPGGEGYFAQLATPVAGPGGQSYKPPYSFAGTAPGPSGLEHGQIVYDTKTFRMAASLPADLFTLPDLSQYQKANPPGCPLEVTHPEPKADRVNCPACHASQPPPG